MYQRNGFISDWNVTKNFCVSCFFLCVFYFLKFFLGLFFRWFFGFFLNRTKVIICGKIYFFRFKNIHVYISFKIVRNTSSLNINLWSCKIHVINFTLSERNSPLIFLGVADNTVFSILPACGSSFSFPRVVAIY